MIGRIKALKPFLHRGFFYEPIPGSCIAIRFYVPSKRADEFECLLQQSLRTLRTPDESDSGRIKVGGIVLIFKGKGGRMTFAGQRLERFDFGKVSAVYGSCYARVAKRPMRFKRGSCRVLIGKGRG